MKADPLGGGDIGLRAIRVRMVGAGGGGGAVDAFAQCAGGGGSGGVYAESFITDIASLDASVTVTRGAGGTAGPPAGSGGTGGASSFGALVSANGGGGGSRGFGERRLGAAASLVTTGTGDLVVPGSAGQFGQFQTYTGAGFPFSPFGGAGGPSKLGGGASRSSDEVGPNGVGFGSGGAGASNFTGSTARNGGAGSNGIVIVDCFV